jgi:hypothetical protein
MKPGNAFETLNINLWAGPGVGKSTTAAALFYKLKLAGIVTEWVPEQAKYLHYSGTLLETPQMAIVEAQSKIQSILQGKVEVTVSDAPVLLSLAYARADELPALFKFVQQATQEWKTLDVLLHRDFTGAYEQAGRYQDEHEARRFHAETLAPFVRKNVGAGLLELEVNDAVDAIAARAIEYVRQARAARLTKAA